MTLITRVSRLFRADMHAVLDRLEEPEALLRQAIRDMEEQVARSNDEFKGLERELAHLDTHSTQLHESGQNIENQLDVCFAAGNELLARNLVRRKLELTRSLAALGARQHSVRANITELGDRLRRQTTVLGEMRQKAQLLIDDIDDTGESEVWPMGASEVHDDDVEIAFLREQQKRARS